MPPRNPKYLLPCDDGAVIFLRNHAAVPLFSLVSAPSAQRFLTAASLLALTACGTPATRSTAVEANVTTRAVGYLQADAVPASLALVPAPPAVGSAGAALDEQVSRQARALRDTPRFAQAHRDAELGFPAGAEDQAGTISGQLTSQCLANPT